MDQTTKRILISCGVISLAACLCLVTAAALGGLAYLVPVPAAQVSTPTFMVTGVTPRSTSTAQETEPPSPQTTEEPEATEEAVMEETEPVPSEIPLAPEIQSAMTQIESEMAEIRGLSSSQTVTRTLITPDDLRVKYEADFDEDYSPEEATLDVIELSALRLVAPDFDFYNFYIDFLVESVAGYYDTEERSMYIVQGQGFTGYEKYTYSHEYNHFLQDMTWGIRDGLGYSEEGCEADSERCAGIQALIEGDASLASLAWLNTYGTDQDWDDIISFYNSYESPIFDSAPPYLQEDMGFPYQTGMEFVQHLYDDGGWESVNAAYANLPDSTEQIMHPERYPDDQPIEVSLPAFTSTLGSGWQMLDEDVIGEWYTYLILAKGIEPAGWIDDDDARTAAEGWGGDRYTIFYNESTAQTVVVVHWVWDTERDSEQFASAFRESTTGLFGGPTSNEGGLTTWESDEGYTLFSEVGNETVWILAPDQQTAEALLAMLD
jgi:hypothetical protein